MYCNLQSGYRLWGYLGFKTWPLEDFNLFTILKDLFLLFYLFQWAKYIEKKNRKNTRDEDGRENIRSIWLFYCLSVTHVLKNLNRMMINNFFGDFTWKAVHPPRPELPVVTLVVTLFVCWFVWTRDIQLDGAWSVIPGIWFSTTWWYLSSDSAGN